MAAQQTKRNNLFLFKRDFNKGANQTLGLPMDQTVIEFVGATEDDPNNRNKYSHFIVHFTPDAGMWSGGTFSLEFKWTHDDGTPVAWPNEPMIAKCLTKIWHPNIDTNGDICHSLVYVQGGLHPNGMFNSSIKMEMVLQGLITLFYMPNFEDPLNMEAGSQGARDMYEFEQQAKQWTQQYASNAPNVPIYKQPTTGRGAPAAHLA